jgi:NADH-quinone oxidoreductase subunit G
MNVATQVVMQPNTWVHWMTQVLKALAEVKQCNLPLDLATITVSDEAKRLAAQLAESKQAHIVLGQVAEMHPEYSQLLALAASIADLIQAKVGVLGAAANSVGAQVVGAVPLHGGMSAYEMIKQPRKAYVLLNTEIELDSIFGLEATSAMLRAESVMVFTPYVSDAMKAYADLLLPIVPNTETAGSFMNMEGRLQAFNPVVKPLGEAKPAWKVLRVLGGLLGLPGFDFDTVETVRAALAPCDLSGTLATSYPVPVSLPAVTAATNLMHVAEMPIYHTDSIVRRATSLQKTVHAANLDRVFVNASTAAALALTEGDQVEVSQGDDRIVLALSVDSLLADGVVKTWSATEYSLGLRHHLGLVDLRKVSA